MGCRSTGLECRRARELDQPGRPRHRPRVAVFGSCVRSLGWYPLFVLEQGPSRLAGGRPPQSRAHLGETRLDRPRPGPSSGRKPNREGFRNLHPGGHPGEDSVCPGEPPCQSALQMPTHSPVGEPGPASLCRLLPIWVPVAEKNGPLFLERHPYVRSRAPVLRKTWPV